MQHLHGLVIVSMAIKADGLFQALTFSEIRLKTAVCIIYFVS